VRVRLLDTQRVVRQLGFQVALDAAGADEAKWQLVCRVGETRSRSDFGTITFSREFLESMVRNWEREGRPEKPWNYFHRGAKSDTSLRNEDKLAAGWVKDMKVDAEGLKLLTRWTPKAKAAILAEELKFPSMEFHENGIDSKTGQPQGPTFYGCALTNNPFLTDLPPVEAEHMGPSGVAVAKSKLEAAIARHERHMNGTEPTSEKSQMKMMEEMKAALAALSSIRNASQENDMITLAQLVSIFGLSKDTTEANLEAALKAKADELGTTKASLEKAQKDLADATKARELSASDEVRKLQASNTELAAKVIALEKRAKDAEVDALIVELERGDGKNAHIVAAQKPQVREFAEKMGVEKAREFFKQFKGPSLGERGATVPDGGITPEMAMTKLQAHADELAKTAAFKGREADALIRAMELHPDLARAAQPATAPKS